MIIEINTNEDIAKALKAIEELNRPYIIEKRDCDLPDILQETMYRDQAWYLHVVDAEGRVLDIRFWHTVDVWSPERAQEKDSTYQYMYWCDMKALMLGKLILTRAYNWIGIGYLFRDDIDKCRCLNDLAEWGQKYHMICKHRIAHGESIFD